MDTHEMRWFTSGGRTLWRRRTRSPGVSTSLISWAWETPQTSYRRQQVGSDCCTVSFTSFTSSSVETAFTPSFVYCATSCVCHIKWSAVISFLDTETVCRISHQKICIRGINVCGDELVSIRLSLHKTLKYNSVCRRRKEKNTKSIH